jgi:hypothetical protein
MSGSPLQGDAGKGGVVSGFFDDMSVLWMEDRKHWRDVLELDGIWR